MKRIFLSIIILSAILSQSTYPQAVPNPPQKYKHNIIYGLVLDSETKKPIPSATVRVEGTNKGTIAAKDGSFRLPKGNFGTQSNIKITSIGYHTKLEKLDLTKDSITIYLMQNPVALQETIVIGEIDVNEIMRRAIAQKNENRSKYKTMQCLLYSKIAVDMKKTVDNLVINKNNISVNFGLNKPTQATDSMQAQFIQGFIGENFSKRFVDNENKISQTIIVNRRQTANFPQIANRVVLEEFVDFSQNEIEFVDTKIITPLNSNALSHYKFELIERKMYNAKYVYVIKVSPNTTVYPTLEGTISILEGTYQLTEANLKPSIDTKIFAIDKLEYFEKFENVGNDIWLPTYLESKASFKIKIMPWLPPIEAEFVVKAIVSDIIINEPFIDSIANIDFNPQDTALPATTKQMNIKNYSKTKFDDGTTKINLVLNSADSTKEEYWEDNALLALDDKEKEMYAQIDTAAKELNIDVNSDSAINVTTKPYFDWSAFPYARFNRVESITAGLELSAHMPYLSLEGEGLYSHGLHRWLGEAKLEIGNMQKTTSLFEITTQNPTNLYYSIVAKIFNKISTFGNIIKDVNLFVNSIDMLILGEDYYDYYRSNGWNATAFLEYKQFAISAMYEKRKDIGLNKFIDYTLFIKKSFRENFYAEESNYQFIRINAVFGAINQMLEDFQFLFSINYQFGAKGDFQSISNPNNFSRIRGGAELQMPIFETGYGEMLLYLSAIGGIAEHNTPVQYLFGMEHSSVVSNIFSPIDNTFITAYNTYFGGVEFFSFHARLNLRDWWWRMLKLPRIKGRGLELSFVAATGRFFNEITPKILYKSTEHGYYTEVGAKIGRIPIPGTDFLFCSLEGRFGVGRYAKGNWGVLFNLNLPFVSASQ